MTTAPAESLLYGLLYAALRPLQRFRKEHAVEPHERETRDYEWFAPFYCAEHKARAKHHFIEWMPDRVVTAECQECGHETEIL